MKHGSNSTPNHGGYPPRPRRQMDYNGVPRRQTTTRYQGEPVTGRNEDRDDDGENRRLENATLFQSWISDPRSIGASGPGRTILARTMAARIDPSLPGPIVELGPGIGEITTALVERGVDPSRLVLMESDPAFCALLRERWPSALVVQLDIYEAPKIMGDMRACGVISGLSLMAHPPRQRLKLVRDCLGTALPAAPFVQFSYFYRSPVPVSEKHLHAEASPIIWSNLPPARVWAYRLVDTHDTAKKTHT